MGGGTDALTPVDVLGGAVRAAGIVELEPTDRGIVLHRMPAWARLQHNDIALAMLEGMPSGGRLEMVTDATTIEIDVHLTLIQLGTEPGPPAAFDLVVDGELAGVESTRTGTLIVIDRYTGAADIQSGGTDTIRFDGLPPGEKRVEVWLPHASAVHLIELRANGAVRPPKPGGARRWVHYGSSISHCLEAERPTGVWPVVAARLAGVDLQSFGLAGQCQLDPFAARMIGQQPADLISLKLGINIVNADSMRERTFVPAVHGFLDQVRDGHPDAPLVVITPITCPVAEDHPGPTGVDVSGQTAVTERPKALALGALTLRRIRELEAEIVAGRQAAGDTNLHLLQGPDLFGPDDVGDLPDGLHPNPAGYQRIGERFHALAFQDGGPFAV
ncbi:MAG: GDSL-type esterase/lipase family protein [Acidimicrobiales bacterium]